MCGIFGIVSISKGVDSLDFRKLASHARQRGRDASGILFFKDDSYEIRKSDNDIVKLIKATSSYESVVLAGHSRLVTNGMQDNQPVVRDDVCLLHNGIVVNHEEVWSKIKIERKYEIDSEAIIGLTLDYLESNETIDGLVDFILANCVGTMSCALFLTKIGKLVLFSNNGSLYIGKKNESTYFASEKFALQEIGCESISRGGRSGLVIDIPISKEVNVKESKLSAQNLVPAYLGLSAEVELLTYDRPPLVRCTKCILPETMPFIQFDELGVCNYCKNYRLRNVPRPKSELFDLVEPYRRKDQPDCIVPFSGGRDSCFGLHLIVKELGMNPITYTYDWGMVTDLGRRNISRMCAELGVENIIVADDIRLKRKNIAKNLKAWLANPDLGMVSILTAGDKHFFRHVETVKRQTGIGLNLWGVNPLEVTHFKAGFLGVRPDFDESRVYMSSLSKQLEYQRLRMRAMLRSPGYFNSSLFDTLSGEYYRSIMKKSDYFHIFDYWTWEENEVNKTLGDYNWEMASDTSTTWRIGDGTAAFYNYIYYTIAGFSEHDTFRSNQIREGQITRELALELVARENQPRYENIRWYLDAIGLEFDKVIRVINSTPKVYAHLI
jgi:glucosamine--fructose-6-phosphate aminotransferase (isomerizing)